MAARLFLAAMLALLPGATALAQEMVFDGEEGGDAVDQDEQDVELAGAAEEGSPVAEPVGAETEVESATQAYAFAVTEVEALVPAAAELDRALRDLLGGSDRYSIGLAESRLHGLDAAAAAELGRAQDVAASGRASYENLEMDAAVEGLGQAVAVYEQAVAHLSDLGPLAECLLQLGAAQALIGSTRSARDTFMRLLIVDPDIRPDPDVYPPDVVEVFDYAVARVASLGEGSITVTSSPEGAEVFVDGVFRGLSPQSLSGLRAGRHFVRVRRHGSVETGRIVEVASRRTASVDFPLEATADGRAVTEILSILGGQLAERPEDAAASVQRLGEIAGVEILLTALLGQSAEGVTVSYTAWDVTRGAVLGAEVAGPLPADEAGIAAGAVATAGAVLEASWASVHTVQTDDENALQNREEEPLRPRRVARPFWQQWWFWTVVGVAVVGAGVGIGFGVAEATRGPEISNGEVIFDL